MATRTSTLYKSTGAIISQEDLKLGKPDKNNLADFVLALNRDNIVYDTIMNLFGEFEGKCICHPYDLLEVPEGAFEYYIDKEKTKTVKNTNKFITTIGIYIFNIFLRDFNFSRFFHGYFNENISDDNYGSIEKRLSYALIEDDIVVEDLKQWENLLQWLMPFETILSPHFTEKLLSSSKEFDKKKAELIKKHKKEIDAGDVNVISEIEKGLIAYAKEYLKDDPSYDTFDSGALADWGNNFKNIFLIKGAMRDPDPNAQQRYRIVTGNYIDGIPAEEYSVVAGGSAEGAYARGKKTENGGYFEKLFVAAYQHLILDKPGSDCGTKRHITVALNKKNIHDYMYSYIIKDNGSLELLDSKNYEKYIGKTVKFRFSSMCQNEKICNKCAGELFYRIDNPRVGASMAQIPDTLKLRCMKGRVIYNTKCILHIWRPSGLERVRSMTL